MIDDMIIRYLMWRMEHIKGRDSLAISMHFLSPKMEEEIESTKGSYIIYSGYIACIHWNR